ncbi:MAG: hypothetical protein JWN44_6599, partial [Myxococcales bacterium]|nr:hypothetical protein [Myxococcales bacterium]
GTYNVIVEGFQPGSEGVVNLTLSVDNDRQLEICNNGVDDDKDGFVDCADRKCATFPGCAMSQCRPDQTIDPVPLDGSTVSKLVQTTGAAVQARPSCEATPGGPTAVVALRLTAKADLKLTWNQLGNHDFALFAQSGTMLPCDAGSLVSCNASGGTGVGMTSWSAVPPGRYFLVVAADTPASAGSVALGLSGTPAP